MSTLFSESFVRRIEGFGGFGDTDHEAVLGRILDAVEADPAMSARIRAAKNGHPQAAPIHGRRAKRHTVTGAEVMLPMVLKALLAAPNHEMFSTDVVAAIEPEVRRVGKPADFQPLPRNPNVLRWTNKCAWARQLGVNQGLVCDVAQSGRGIWKLTAKGVSEAKKLR